jgi:glycosyltransferase involved in cell wall biosynthesis
MRQLRPVNDVFGAGRLAFGMVTSYPPTACGIATFGSALAGGLERCGASRVGAVRISDGFGQVPDDRVVGSLLNGSPDSLDSVAARMSRFDVVIVQHEYGLYGGADGDEVITLLRRLEVPTIVVAHTILVRPTAGQRATLQAVAAEASAVVVMTHGARQRLSSQYGVDLDRIVVIPHGASTDVPPRPVRPRVPYMLTWGLLGPGKGIERVIDAMASLRDLSPRPHYVIAGCTHPKVLAAHGDRYRDMLVRRSWENGTAAHITLDPAYRDLRSLAGLIHGASVVVLPYDSDEQATSGVLVDAVAAGRPVVATAFPHAIDLLSSGAGIVVQHDDQEALATALRRVMTEPGLARAMAEEASRLAPELSWDAVSRRYLELGEQLCSRSEAQVVR